MTVTRVRKSVPLTPEDTSAVELLREDSTYREALAAVSGAELSEHPSEAEALQALVALGRSVLTEQVRATGYAALAAAQSTEDRDITRALAGRRR